MCIVKCCARFISELSKHTDARNITQSPNFKEFQANLEEIQRLIETNPRKARFILKHWLSADSYATKLQRLQTRVGDALNIYQATMITDVYNIVQHQNTSCENHIPDAREEDITVIKCNDITLEYQMHVGREVFEGRENEENFRKTIESEKRLWHPNILSLNGRSASTACSPFTVYYTNTRGSAIQHIAKVVPSGVDSTFAAGARLIADLADALDYLSDHAVLSFNASEILYSEEASPFNSSDKAVNMLGELCSKIFNSANGILYNDYIAPLDDNIMGEEPSSASVGRQLVGIDPNIRSSDEMSEAPAVPPRREIKWQTLRQGTITLKHMSQQYRNVLISSTPLNRAIRSTDAYRIRHRCRGYRREEVIFTTSAMDCEVVTSTMHFSKRCPICGEYPNMGFFHCRCTKFDDGITPIVQCAQCSTWGHSDCMKAIDVCPSCHLENALKKYFLTSRLIQVECAKKASLLKED
ncbi:hypothetical protein IW261DRAFT_914110 [Armillaria novae-zelandiae]|uniref:Uncharacterized protein n=1 Tax=Armillaria novae-zelandiae TaxID=153914 RepID=A0AA39NSH7_9AGAR|nr:hypothetical protein IW261DRAFT_914110 [Armillaria novae-zelandiae]